jgi:hypothetical protein
MKKSIYFITAFLIIIAFINSCANNNNSQSTESNVDSVKSEAQAQILDPHQPKPMALMMRQMADNADSMKAKLARGESLDSLQFPFIRFYLVQATDESVKEPKFYENAKQYQTAHNAIFTHPKEQKKYYNLMIGKCISCHENYCSGPLKRIRKMPITE